MSKQGEVLVSYNNQLVKCIEDMREKMDTVTKKITKLEEEKIKVTENITNLTEQLSNIEETLAKNINAKNKYAQTIQETEAAYMKILESSQTLLHVLKREQTKISKKH
jgi:Sjoegren syndrome nuclear autoantigen 1